MAASNKAVNDQAPMLIQAIKAVKQEPNKSNNQLNLINTAQQFLQVSLTHREFHHHHIKIANK